MTVQEAARLLAMAAAYDQRHTPPSPADALLRAQAWQVALDTDLPVKIAENAVIAHYKASTDMVMPAHINGYWSARRHLVPRPAIEPPAEPAPLEVVRQLTRDLRRTLGRD